MPWDSVEVGLAGGEETVNFGPRNESGSSLYQVDTLASVSPRGEVRFYSLSNTYPSLCVDREGMIFWIFVQRKTARSVLLTARQSMPIKMTNIKGMIWTHRGDMALPYGSIRNACQHTPERD